MLRFLCRRWCIIRSSIFLGIGPRWVLVAEPSRIITRLIKSFLSLPSLLDPYLRSRAAVRHARLPRPCALHLQDPQSQVSVQRQKSLCGDSGLPTGRASVGWYVVLFRFGLSFLVPLVFLDSLICCVPFRLDFVWRPCWGRFVGWAGVCQLDSVGWIWVPWTGFEFRGLDLGSLWARFRFRLMSMAYLGMLGVVPTFGLGWCMLGLGRVPLMGLGWPFRCWDRFLRLWDELRRCWDELGDGMNFVGAGMSFLAAG